MPWTTAQGHAPRSLTCQSVDFRSVQHQARVDGVIRSTSGHAHAWKRCIVACFLVHCRLLLASPRPAKSSSCISPSIATLRAFNTSSLSVSPYRLMTPYPHVWRAAAADLLDVQIRHLVWAHSSACLCGGIAITYTLLS